MLSDCGKCGEPLFDYVAQCPQCHAANPAHRGESATPTSSGPWPERLSYVVGVVGLTLAALQGLGILFQVSGRGTTPGRIADFLLSLGVGVAGILVPLKTDILVSEPRPRKSRATIYATLMLAVALLYLPFGAWWDGRSLATAETHYDLGARYGQQKDWPRAEASYLKALELRPGWREAYAALAAVYEESRQREKGIELLKTAAARNPGDPVFLTVLGLLHLNAGQGSEAEAALRKALDLDPGNAEAHFHLGAVFVGQNRVPEAVQHLEKYVALSPRSARNVATAEGLLLALKTRN